jgi:xanthine dehydrogenase YagR molybdenum-binding subunit
MRDGRWLIGWGMATATYPMNFAPASARARLLPGRHGRGEQRGQRHGAGHMDLHDPGGSRDAGPADRAGEIRAGRHPAAQGPGAWRLDDDGERRQRRAGGLPEGARGILARWPRHDIAEAMRASSRPIEATQEVQPGKQGEGFSKHAFGAVFVEVAVDPDLGETRVRRIVGAYGAGRVVNPKLARSQCIGGMIGGIGMALMEHSVVDARNGRVPNANLAEYPVPVHADAPPVMDVIFVPRSTIRM